MVPEIPKTCEDIMTQRKSHDNVDCCVYDVQSLLSSFRVYVVSRQFYTLLKRNIEVWHCDKNQEAPWCLLVHARRHPSDIIFFTLQITFFNSINTIFFFQKTGSFFFPSKPAQSLHVHCEVNMDSHISLHVVVLYSTCSIVSGTRRL